MVRRQNFQDGVFTMELAELQRVVQKLKQFLGALMQFKITANGAPQQPSGAIDMNTQIPQTGMQPNFEGNNNQNQLAPGMVRKPSTQKSRAGGKSLVPSQDQVGFQIGAASPHGAPVYHPTITGFQASNLAIPESVTKKRKQNQKSESSNNTPSLDASVAPTIPSDQAQQKALAQAKTEQVKVAEPIPAKVVHPFKCPIPHCDFHHTGFESQDVVDKHAAEAHDYHGDPLAWCLANMQRALGLDSNGKILKDPPKPTDTKASDQTNAKLAVPLMKKEMLTPAATPMSRAGTQQGMKMETTPINMLKTPQMGFKPGSPESSGTAMKRTASALINMPTPAAAPQKLPATPEDLWSKSLVSREAIAYVFSDLEGFTTFENLPTPPPIVWADTPESNKSSIPSDASTTSAVRVTMEEWDPFGIHKGLRVKVTQDEEWNKIDFETRFGPRAGLDDDGGEMDRMVWKSCLAAVKEPEMDFEMIEKESTT